MSGLSDVRLVESALFSAGKPLPLEEICNATGLHAERAKDALKALETELDGDQTSLCVTKAGGKWVMQLKAAYVEHSRKLAPREIPGKLLKTLALIAFHQPLKQSELVKMIGPKTYDHVPELHERGLVRVREEGQTKILATSELFPEYFGIPAEAKEDIKTFLAKKVGLMPRTVAGDTTLGAFPAKTDATTAAADAPPQEDAEKPDEKVEEASAPSA